MTASGRVKGWCPGAWRPMASGDGLIVRVRPRFGTLSRSQVLIICDASRRWGSGTIDLTNRGNVQLRGVHEQDWRSLLTALIEADLIDSSPEAEARPPVLVAPDWQPDDDNYIAAQMLSERLGELPALPAKVGFAVDAGPVRLLTDDPADFRIERAMTGSLMVRADGRELGTPVESVGTAVNTALRLARWFGESAGEGARRMKRRRDPLPDWLPEAVRPVLSQPSFPLGKHPLGLVYGLRFGQVSADALRKAVLPENVRGVRVTPWRRLLIEGAHPEPLDGLLTDEGDPGLTTDACPGKPFCEQATVPTRELAQQLAGEIKGRLHVSGCPKGCARQRPADTCIVGEGGRYGVIFQGRADETPEVAGLTESQLRSYFGVE